MKVLCIASDVVLPETRAAIVALNHFKVIGCTDHQAAHMLAEDTFNLVLIPGNFKPEESAGIRGAAPRSHFVVWRNT